MRRHLPASALPARSLAARSMPARSLAARALLVLALPAALLLAAPAGAVQPDEMLADPALEARARELSKELRCLVCRNENIDDSNAALARDLRLLVRERLTAGDTNEEALAYLTDRYGEYVLLKPTFAHNMTLWLAGPALLVLGGIVAFTTIRRSRPAAAAPEARAAAAPLSADEKAKLDALLNG